MEFVVRGESGRRLAFHLESDDGDIVMYATDHLGRRAKILTVREYGRIRREADPVYSDWGFLTDGNGLIEVV